jgi:hypothetical protein
MIERGDEPGLLSEAITRHMAATYVAPPVRVTEDLLTFTCRRCGRTLSAAQALITRNPGKVAYSCPDDGATFVTIHGPRRGSAHAAPWDYHFSEVDLTIRVGAEQVAWWDFVHSADPDPPPSVITGSFSGTIYADEDNDQEDD